MVRLMADLGIDKSGGGGCQWESEVIIPSMLFFDLGNNRSLCAETVIRRPVIGANHCA